MEWAIIFGVGGLALLVGGVALIVWGWRHDETLGRRGTRGDHDLTALIVLGGFLAVLGLVTALAGGISTAVSNAGCTRYGDRLGLETEWQLVGGCYVQVDDRMVPQSWIVPVIEGERLRIEVQISE